MIFFSENFFIFKKNTAIAGTRRKNRERQPWIYERRNKKNP